jgi:glycosyltransferase involved in cell wall biosynthesis
MKIILLHEWLKGYGGSERVVESILRCVSPSALYTLIDTLPLKERGFLQNIPVKTSFLQKLPWIRSKNALSLILMPLAIERFDISGADLVISSSHAVAKGVLTDSEQLHICYCHSPIRYAWDLTHNYLNKSGLDKGIKGVLARIILHYIRLWDYCSANRVDFFVANSKYIARRIWRVYRRESAVIYPPVNVDNFEPCNNKEDYYLAVSRLVPYKNMDLIVESFAKTNKKLVVVGDGQDFKKTQKLATKNVELLGYQSTEIVKSLMQKARAFVFAADEDFGIVPVEAQASGTPVIAFGRGGSLETVKGVFPGTKPSKGTTGIFFREPSAASLLEALDWFELHRDKLAPAECRKNAEQFACPRFEREFTKFVQDKWQAFNNERSHNL